MFKCQLKHRHLNVFGWNENLLKIDTFVCSHLWWEFRHKKKTSLAEWWIKHLLHAVFYRYILRSSFLRSSTKKGCKNLNQIESIFFSGLKSVQALIHLCKCVWSPDCGQHLSTIEIPREKIVEKKLFPLLFVHKPKIKVTWK